MKTSLGEKNEALILAELAPIIDKYAKKTRQDSVSIESAVAYLWKSREEEIREDVRKMLSSMDYGPYGGR